MSVLVMLRKGELDQFAGPVARKLKDIADETHLFILCQLEDGPKNLADIAKAMKMDKASIRQEAEKMQEDGLVTLSGEGQKTVCAPASPDIEHFIRLLARIFADHNLRE